ncbi:uncharacterized protein LOC121378910 [Gigantopelta aegis]|uniref:uncharacterized protein LOC121378910 n=1 Tax=Gigantopelta aegis TaxID=1735272 RepID=UPI001B88DF32|nr:uncharacterized protein LOC121378910 [Gigantopelta aegis]
MKRNQYFTQRECMSQCEGQTIFSLRSNGHLMLIIPLPDRVLCVCVCTVGCRTIPCQTAYVAPYKHRNQPTKMRRWTFSFNQSAAIVISLVEPITTVFIYPLIVDIYLAGSLVKTCDVMYTILVHLLLLAITLASLCAMKFGMENICQLHSSFEGKKQSLFFTFSICAVWNVLFTIYIMVFHNHWALVESYVPHNMTTPPVKIEAVFSPALKILIPQISLLFSVLVVATAMSVCRPTWKASDKATLKKIWIYLLMSLLFQTIYMTSRLAFWHCSNTVYDRLSKTIDFIDWICYSKSFVFIVVIMSFYYLQYFIKTELARRGVISIMDYRPLFNNDH